MCVYVMCARACKYTVQYTRKPEKSEICQRYVNNTRTNFLLQI